MNIKDLFELDFAYLDAFTNRTETPWGYLFYNEDIPGYYDANHALIGTPVRDHEAVINEVMDYYQAKNIIPRFYLYQLDQLEDFIKSLQARNFQLEELVSPVQLWNKELIEQPSREEISIEQVTEENYPEALEIECSIKEFGGRTVREKAFEQEFKHPGFIHYLLRYKGEACATACLFIAGKQARMESVATLEAYRGKGLIGYLIRHIQAQVQDMENLWVFPINENIEKVYQKYGFDTVEKLKTGHAFLGGKSLTEIQS